MSRAGAIALILVAQLASLPAALAQDWLGQVTGPYQGPVLNAGQLQQLDTAFSLDGQGHLVGHYHVEDQPPFDGELTGFRPDGDGRTGGTFIWHDRFGEGIVHVTFDPALGRFTGYWGDDQAQPGQIFNGYRVRPPAVS